MQLIRQLIGRGDKHWLLGGTNSHWGLNILGGQTYCSGGGQTYCIGRASMNATHWADHR